MKKAVSYIVGLVCLLPMTACEPETFEGAAEVDVTQASLPIWNGIDDCAGSATCETPEIWDTSALAESIRERNGTVQVVVRNNATNWESCTGTLLTPQLVLTAAHCFDTATDTADIEVHVTPDWDVSAGSIRHRRDIPTTTPPAIFRGPANRLFAWQDLALMTLVSPETQASITNLEDGTLITANEVMTWGYPVALRRDPMVNVQHDVELAGYGMIARTPGNHPPYTFPSVRQTQPGFHNFPFMKWDIDPAQPQMLIRVFFGEPFVGIDQVDSGGPLFVLDGGRREQAGVAIQGCAPHRIIKYPDSTGTMVSSRVPSCTMDACPGGFVDITGACNVTAPACCESGVLNGSTCVLPDGGTAPAGYVDLEGACRLPPMRDGVVVDIQPCDDGGRRVTGDINICQVQGKYWSNWVDVTSGDARNWILTNGGDKQRPGRLFGERDYNGYCRSDVDANCDRWIDPVDSCPAVFDSGDAGGFYPEDYNRMDDLAVYAGRGFSINDRAEVYASDGTLGTVAAALAGHVSYIRSDSKVGRVISPGYLWFGHRYTVESIVKNATTTIWTQDGADLSPLTVAGANIPQLRYVPQFPWSIDIEEINIEPGQQYPQNPGERLPSDTYARVVHVKSGATLKLRGADGTGQSGKYYFDELYVEPGGRIEFDRPSGHTEIHVRNLMTYNQGEMVTIAGDPNATLLTINSGTTTHITGTFRGTVVAPLGSIVLDASEHYGAFYARDSVTLHQGGRIYHRPLVCE